LVSAQNVRGKEKDDDVIESFIIALREGIEVALVLGILIVSIRKIKRPSLSVAVYLGLGTAIAASVVGAIILQSLALDHEFLEGFFMIAAAIFVGSMVVWMWMTAKGIRKEIEQKIDELVEKPSPWQMHAGMFTFTFLMVIREGIETAVFLQAVALSTDAWLSLAGALLGFGVATAFAVLFIRGSLKIDIVRFLRVTAVTLLIFVAQLLANGFHEFYEFGILPANPQMMGFLGPIVRNNTLFIIAIISIPALMLVIPSTKVARGRVVAPNRRVQFSAGLVALSIVFFLGVGNLFSSGHSRDLSAVPLDVPEDGVIRIPLESVSDGNLHRYAIADDGLEIRFFVLRTGLGKFATAFDACYACYNYGRYFLRDGELICSQCDAPSSLMRLRLTGEEEQSGDMSGSMEGNRCAPIFLPSIMRYGQIRITLADLQHQRKYFDTSAQ
jgi:high-affinity iron transporter